MGCFSHRRKVVELRAEQKWDYINLKDFRNKGCGTPTAYGYLWLMLVLSVAVYAVDTFTAINLLAFNQWSSEIRPAIDLNISKWIFSICIILSFLNLGYEGIRAYRVIKRGNIAECYLDSLAVRWESIRMGKGQGWRRFLVFAELTKSKKGAEYIALFTYFSFQSWIRVLICSGPRQVVNAFTLKSVYESDLLTIESNAGASFATFFSKLKLLAERDYRQAAILSGMLFTMVIWVFSMLFLIFAVIFYVTFLFHWIPRADGGLTGYCERKVNSALLKIVSVKVDKALAREEETRWKAELKAARKKGEKPVLERSATLPTIPDVSFADTDKLPEMPMLSRAETMTSMLPAYTSRPPSPGSVGFGPLDRKRPFPPSRAGTLDSEQPAYSSRLSLLAGAADLGRSASPFTPPNRTGTASTVRSAPPQWGPGSAVAATDSGSSALARELTETPMPAQAQDGSVFYPLGRPAAGRSVDSYGRPMPGDSYADARTSPAPRTDFAPGMRSSPALSTYPARGRAQNGPDDGRGPRSPPWNNAYPQPLRSATATNPVGPRGPASLPQRSFTGPLPPRQAVQNNDYHGRSTTAPGAGGAVNPNLSFEFDLENQRNYRV